MPKRIIDDLREEQEAMIPIYRDKWRSLSLLTEASDREKAATAIKAAYEVDFSYFPISTKSLNFNSRIFQTL